MVTASLLITLLILSVFAVGFYIACALFTVCFFASQQYKYAPNRQPVSVLIPVKGVDEGASDNWTSFCQQDYDVYEVLFGVMDPSDLAVPVLENLVAKFPGHTRLLTGLEVRGINHQISNLSHLVEAAQYEQVVFADSDIRVTSEYLRQVTAPLTNPAIGVVTCGYLDHAPKSLGAAIASLGRCIDFIPSVLIARALDGGLKFALGPTIATRKSVLEKFGGLQQVLNRIGSDFHIGRLAVEAGYQVELSTYVLENDCGQETLKQVCQRELRWSRTIRWNRGLQYYGMIFTFGTIYSSLLVLVSGCQPWAIATCLITFSVRLAESLITIYSLRCPQLVRWLWTLPLRDGLSLIIWLLGSYGQRIFWRGRWLEVGNSGILQEKSTIHDSGCSA